MTRTTFSSCWLVLSIAAALATPALAVPPNPPVLTSATWTAANSLSMTWQDTSTDETGFAIVYRVNPSANYSIFTSTVGPNTTTFTATPHESFRVCDIIFEWAVVSYKGPAAAREYSEIANTREMISPPPVGTTQCAPVFRTTYLTGLINTPLALQITAVRRNSSNGALITLTSGMVATGLPAGLSMSAGGNVTGTQTSTGRHTLTVTAQEAGSPLATKTVKIHIFRPVPALAGPVNPTPLPVVTLRRNATPLQIDLAAHFNDPDVSDASRLVFNTGTIDFLYYPAAAPATVTNFKGYISRGDFVNTIIHRSLPGFVLQGGGYKAEAGTPSITRQPAVVNEPEISNTRGTVAMAKSGGNPNSATSEFFISLADNSSNLNNQNEGFSVFARVPAAGMAVADSIASLCTFDYSSTNGVLTDCPVTTFGPPCPVPKPAAPAFNTAALVKLLSAGPVAPLSYASGSSLPAVCGVSVNGAQLTLTPLIAGTAVISVTATDLDNLAITGTFNVTVEEHLSDWLTAQNFPNGADASATADPDFDGAENIIEFAMMTDPQSSSPLSGPVAGTTVIESNRYLTLAFPVRKLAGGGFLYAVEASSGLAGAWETVWTSTQGFAHPQVLTFTDLADRTNVTIRDTAAITSGQRRFLRLRVTDTP